MALPLSPKDILGELSSALQDDLKDHFRQKNLTLSDNGYVFFQLFDTQKGIVRYDFTGSFNLHTQSRQWVLTTLKSSSGLSSFEKVEHCLRRAIWDDGLRNSPDRARTTIDKNIENACKRAFDGVPLITQESENIIPLDYVTLALQEYLRITEQPLSIGLAKKRFDEATSDPIADEDIFAAQESESAGTAEERAIYSSIKSVEKLFFYGGLRRGRPHGSMHGSSFIVFVDLFCFGQRSGYLFVIEAFEDRSERTKKIEATKQFLLNHKERVEEVVKMSKETEFLTSMLKAIEEHYATFSQKKLVSIVAEQLPALLNVRTRERIEEWKEVTMDVTFDNECNMILPVSLNVDSATAGSVSEVPCALRIPMYMTDLDGVADDVEKIRGIKRPWNKMKFVTSFSMGLSIFGLAFLLQKHARSSEWENLFHKLWHSVQFHLVSAIDLTADLEKRLSRYNDSSIHTFPSEYLHDLRYLLELSRYVDNPKEYFEAKEGGKAISPKLVDVEKTIQKILKMINVAVFYDHGRLLRATRDMMSAYRDTGEESLFRFVNASSNCTIETYEEVMEVVLKDILVNATAKAVDIDLYKKDRSSLPLVSVKLYDNPSNDNELVLGVSNNCGISQQAYDLWTKGKMPEKSEFHKPLGILIARNFLDFLGYRKHIAETCVRDKGGTSTTISIFLTRKLREKT